MRDAAELYMYIKMKNTLLHGMLFLSCTEFWWAAHLCARKIKIKSISPSPAFQNICFVLFQYS